MGGLISTLRTGLVELKATNDAVEKYANTEITIPILPNMGGDKTYTNRDAAVKWWKNFFKQEGISATWDEFLDTITLSLTGGQLTSVIKTERLRNLTTPFLSKADAEVRDAIKVSDLGDDVLNTMLEVMRLPLPEATLDEYIYNTLPGVYHREISCSVCETQLSLLTTLDVQDDSVSWYTDENYPLVMSNVDASVMADLVFLSQWGLGRRPKAPSRNMDAQIVRYDALSARYATRRALDDIEALVRTTSIEFPGYEMPNSVKSNILAKLHQLSSNATQEAFNSWIANSIEQISENVVVNAQGAEIVTSLDAPSVSLVKARFTERANAWISTATRRVVKTKKDKVENRPKQTERIVLFLQLRVIAEAETTKHGMIKYYSNTFDPADVHVYVGHDSVATVLDPYIDNLVTTDRHSESRSAAWVLDHLENHLKPFLPQGTNLSVELSATLIDMFTGTYNKQEDQLITLVKDMFGSSVWHTATLEVKKKTMDGEDFVRLQWLEDKASRAALPEELAAPQLSTEEAEELALLLGKYEIVKSVSNFSVYPDEVAITSLVSNLPETLRRFCTIDSHGDNVDVAIRGMAHAVIIPLNVYTYDEILETCQARVIDQILDGVKDIRIKVSVMQQAKLLGTKFKIDDRFITGNSVPGKIITKDQLSEVGKKR
jgi:hypothetical protein